MEFKAGDRVHVTRLNGRDVNIYGILGNAGDFAGKLLDCKNGEFISGIYLPTSSNFGPNKTDYYTLATDEEDTEEPVIQRVEDIKRYIPDTKNLIESAFEEIEQSIYNFNQSKVNNQKVELDNHYIIEVKKGLYVEEVGSYNHFKFTKDINKAKIYEVKESIIRQDVELLDGRILNLKRFIEV